MFFKTLLSNYEIYISDLLKQHTSTTKIMYLFLFCFLSYGQILVLAARCATLKSSKTFSENGIKNVLVIFEIFGKFCWPINHLL